jgi:V-type H+-transporting ATPase subunit d
MSLLAASLPAPGGLATFNISHGYVEALVRGMRMSFLSDSDYHHMTQCDSLEDVKMNLSETDYASKVMAEAEMTPGSLQRAAVGKLTEEFQ